MKYYFSLKILFKSLSHQNKPFFYQLTIIRFQASKLRNKSFCRVSNFLKFIIFATFLYFCASYPNRDVLLDHLLATHLSVQDEKSQKNSQNFQKIQKVLQFSTFNPNFHFFTTQIMKQNYWKIIF